jgi:hypothetical protein
MVDVRRILGPSRRENGKPLRQGWLRWMLLRNPSPIATTASFIAWDDPLDPPFRMPEIMPRRRQNEFIDDGAVHQISEPSAGQTERELTRRSPAGKNETAEYAAEVQWLDY